MVTLFVIGSLVFDLVVKTPRRPQKGETFSGDYFGMFPGGKGANQAVAASRLGARARMCGRVGNDAFGKLLMKNLKKENVGAAHITMDKKTGTGVASIMVDREGDNSIVVVPNANAKVTVDDVKRALPALKKSDAVLLQLEIPLPVVYYSAQLAKDEKKKVILNPAPAREIPETLLSVCDVVIPNEQEAGQLSRTRVRSRSDVVYAAKQLMKRGATNVVITLGDKGVFWMNEDTKKFFPAFSVKAADTTACGDAFCAAFSVAYCGGKSMADSIVFASAAGALTASKIGAQPSLPYRREVEALLRKKQTLRMLG